jgi:hypothetical protein
MQTIRAICVFRGLRIFAVAAALICSALTATARTPKPDLLTPSASHLDWLFNVGTNGTREKFTWKAVPGATEYQFVLDESLTYANYYAMLAVCTSATACKAITTAETSLDHKKLAGFWFLPKRYHWKVRAKKNGLWGDWATSRSFRPYIYMDIAVRAYGNGNPNDSPLSRLKGTTSNPSAGPTWLTELDAESTKTFNGYDADGALLLAAHASYKAAVNKNLGTSSSPTSLRRTMRQNLTRDGGWALREQDLLINRIKDTYNATQALTRSNVLERLGIRAQCKEFADRMVIDGGGKPKTYDGMVSVGVGVKPGHYIAGAGHAAIANAVRFKSNGDVEARISESNWHDLGDGNWASNPKGQTPWRRAVQHTRQILIKSSGPMKAYRAH